MDLLKIKITVYLSSPKKIAVLIYCLKLLLVLFLRFLQFTPQGGTTALRPALLLVLSFSTKSIPLWRLNYIIPLPKIYGLPQMSNAYFILKPHKRVAIDYNNK